MDLALYLGFWTYYSFPTIHWIFVAKLSSDHCRVKILESTYLFVIRLYFQKKNIFVQAKLGSLFIMYLTID